MTENEGIIKQAIDYSDKIGRAPTRGELQKEFLVSESLAKNIVFFIANKDVLETIDSLEKGGTKCRDKTGEDIREVITVSAKIKTEDEALDYAKVDRDVWYVKLKDITSWEVTMGRDKTGTGYPETYTNFRVALKLARITDEKMTPKQMAEEFGKLIKNYKPKLLTINHIIKEDDKWMMKVSYADPHHGQLSWKPEAGDNWDIHISTNTMVDGSKYFASVGKSKNVSRILHPIGNDFFNVDNDANTTSKGTPQHEDVRYQKSFVMGLEAAIESINILSQVAPIDVEFVMGNHDAARSFYMVVALQQYYRQSKIVKINITPSFRKYYNWGLNLIGMSHGDKENLADIPSIMAMESSTLWAKCKNHYFFHGHLHHEKRLIKEIVDTKKVQVEFDPSLVANSAWAKGKGLMAVRKTKANLFHKEHGNVEDVRYFYEGD